MPASHWPFKLLHDAAQQWLANCIFLPAPILLMAVNPRPQLHALEALGLCLWAAAWAFETAADTQKMRFLRAARERGDVATAVLGHAPYDGPAYRLWTLCRHPNYFGEFACWLGLCLGAVPSLWALVSEGQVSRLNAGLWAFTLLAILRLFYDCLLDWTGAGPAEYYSGRKRPAYAAYQAATRCFFPLELPLVDHHRVPGWPLNVGQGGR